MSFVFVDRESGYPNRYLITKENGSTEYVVLERADDPIVVGTPLNAETFNALFEELVNASVGVLTAIDFSNLENGSFTETVDGVDINHPVIYDTDGRPSAIDGIEIKWGTANG